MGKLLQFLKYILIVSKFSLFVNFEFYGKITYMIEKIIKIALILILGLISQKTINVLAKRIRILIKKAPLETISQKKQRVKTLISLIVHTANLTISTIVLFSILAELGINIAPLLTGVGILGLAIGFGAKTLVADFIAGFFILLENQFNIGDEVNLASNWQGKVIKVSLRTTTLKDKEGKVYIVPNSQIKAVIKLPKN